MHLFVSLSGPRPAVALLGLRRSCRSSTPCGSKLQETYDLDSPLDETAKKLIDAAGAGQSNMSPGWLTELGRLWGGTSVRNGSSVLGCLVLTTHNTKDLVL